MRKKYLVWLLFLGAAICLYWIKSNQRGPAYYDEGLKQEVSRTEWQNKKLTFSRHARCRMDCREIDEAEVREIIRTGVINYSRIREDEKGKTIPLEGKTRDGQNVRIVFAPKPNETVVVTVIDLDTEYKCDCT